MAHISLQFLLGFQCADIGAPVPISAHCLLDQRIIDHVYYLRKRTICSDEALLAHRLLRGVFILCYTIICGTCSKSCNLDVRDFRIRCI